MVLSTVDAYLQLLEIPEGEARRRAWVTDYEAVHPAVFQTYYSGWGDREQRDAAADDVTALAATIRRREARATTVVERAGRDLAELGVLDYSDIPTVLMVGVHTSNGWVTVEGEPTLFLALECLPDQPFDEVLALHEAVHVAQRRLAPSEWPVSVAARLLLEGVPTAVTRQLRPGLADSAYLWFDDAHEEWVNECQQREAEILPRVVGSLATEDSPVVSELFDNKKHTLLPTRCGYWIGEKVAQRLLDGGTQVGELLRSSYPEALERTKSVLRLLTAERAEDCA